MSRAANQPVRISSAMRQHWANQVLQTCLLHAELHGIIEPSQRKEFDTDLQVLPGNLHEVVFAKCQDLIERSCRAAARGKAEHQIGQLMNGELWDFLRAWRRGDVVESRAASHTNITIGNR